VTEVLGFSAIAQVSRLCSYGPGSKRWMGRGTAESCRYWIPACAGMTVKTYAKTYWWVAL